MSKAATKNLSVSDLEAMLKTAKDRVATLQKERADLMGRVDRIDKELADLGADTKGPRKRAKTGAKAAGKKSGRKKMTLGERVVGILKAAKGPMSPKEIAEALKRKGVSKSKYLATQVMQVLRKNKASIQKVGRGQYAVEDGE